MDSQKKKYIIYGIFFFINLGLFLYSFIQRTGWALDIFLYFSLITLVLMYQSKLRLTTEGFFLINIGFLLHGLGTFGFYAKTWGMFGYDNVVHLLFSLAITYVCFNFVSRRLHVHGKKVRKKTVVDEHIVILIVLVVALASMLGVMVEIIEFSGFLYFGEGEGVFFVGAGDSNVGGDMIEGQYIDTMTDILVNTLGALIGVILYYKIRYKKKYWLSC